jgi:hypothetical protein
MVSLDRSRKTLYFPEKSNQIKPMKKQLTAIAMTIATASFCYGAEPDKAPEKRGPREGRPVPPEVLEKFDKDGDGKLNEEERKAAMEARQAEMLAKFDKDGDGKLSQDERKAAMEARRAEMMKRFDKNGDGKLDEEERKALPPRGGRPGPGRPEGGKGPKGPGKKAKKPAGE